eukprot:4906670-Amphidinium_carterae.1
MFILIALCMRSHGSKITTPRNVWIKLSTRDGAKNSFKLTQGCGLEAVSRVTHCHRRLDTIPGEQSPQGGASRMV